jgi:hypothetical protein
MNPTFHVQKQAATTVIPKESNWAATPASQPTDVSIVRSFIVVAKLAKSFGDAAIPKVLATFATTNSDTYSSNGTKLMPGRTLVSS